MKATVMLVTPELAKSWIEKNRSGQRKVKTIGLNTLRASMRDGRFMSNGESIIFDWYGNLMDGQHRLLAIIDSGISVEMVVVTEVDPAAFNTIDGPGGGARSGSDLLHMNGEKNTVVLSGICKNVVSYVDYKEWPGRTLGVSRGKVSQSEIADSILRFPELRDIASRIVGSPAARVISATQAGFLMWCVGPGFESDIALFFERVGLGLGLENTDPEYHLRRRFLECPKNRAISQSVKWDLTAKAWNCRARGQKMRLLRDNHEQEETWLMTDRGTELYYEQWGKDTRSRKHEDK